MLTQLSIKNIVLIEQAQIDFRRGLCVLSGETGAGKSILLDALGLALGARSDAALIRRQENQGSVCAAFDISGNGEALAILQEMGIEVAEMLLIRRDISSDGKSRAYVNDVPVTIAALKRLGEQLVEIHGQHDQRALGDNARHRQLLDEFAGNSGVLRNVAIIYQQWQQARNNLSALLAEISKAESEQDYLLHMHKELSALAPQEGEEEKLSDERSRMMNGEKLCAVLNEAIGILNSKDVLGNLRAAQKTLLRSPLSCGYTKIIEALEKAAIEAEEALETLEEIGAASNFNATKLDNVEERLFALKAAARKYNKPVAELAKLRDEISAKLALINNRSQEAAIIEKQAALARANYIEAASSLSALRKKAALLLQKTIKNELSPLKMEGTHFRVRIDEQPEQSWAEHGKDLICFECATNVSNVSNSSKSDNSSKNPDYAPDYAPLAKIASGGELSRLMLALNVALADKRKATTLVFDEIDSGTGGAVADAIGKRLAILGESSQVLVVTHLPQVAACGDWHLLVSKKQNSGKTTTMIEALSGKNREEELARMLAGEKITKEARSAAKKLLEQAA